VTETVGRCHNESKFLWAATARCGRRSEQLLQKRGTAALGTDEVGNSIGVLARAKLNGKK
jgi:hypothetical protein